ncbi:MAG: type III-A CRISPR-associated RAMP protein Csm5 [Anaerolineae bacterium]|nr:type III-A CRISPR-associated RAMP protein Csm5 [Anaerolineae bacterium]
MRENKQKTIYDLKLNLLTPLHIGNGDTFMLNFDFVVHHKQTWLINQERFADHVLGTGDGRFDQLLDGAPPGQLLQAEDFTNKDLFRYALPGTPHMNETGVEIRQHLKDVYDRPYIPGSSLKGALRTVLLRHSYQKFGRTLRPDLLDNNRKRAGQAMEQDLLSSAQERRGKAPNYSLLRALQVADSGPVSSEKMVLHKARVFGRRKADIPINLECISQGTTLETSLIFDDYLFNEAQAAARLQFGAWHEWLRKLPELANAQAQRRIQQEIEFYQKRGQSPALAFYKELSDLIGQQQKGQFVIQVGWGGGWDSKTLAYLLPDPVRDEVVVKFSLARNYFKAGETPFPRTRRAVGRGPDGQIEPLRPFGWLLVEMKERT